MFKYLLDIVKNMKGNVLTIGIDDKILNGFNKNKSVNVYTLDKADGFFGKSKKRKNNKGKTINIKKLYKYFNKKSLNYIICDYNEIENYLKYVVKDVVILNSNKIYIYCQLNTDVDLIIKRFKRYGGKTTIHKFKDNMVLEIDNTKSKTNWIKNKIYFLNDTGYNFVEIVSNVLTS